MALDRSLLRGRAARGEEPENRNRDGDVPLSIRVQPCPHYRQRYTPKKTESSGRTPAA